MLFLELWRDSRVTKGNSGFLLCWPRVVQSYIRVVRESGGLLSSYIRAKETSSRLVSRTELSSPGVTGTRGCIPDSRGVRPRLEGKPRTPLSSRVATRVSWSPLRGLNGVQPPLPFGERTQDCSPGHAGKEDPHLAMTGASCWFSRAAVPVCGF